jgi:membrane protein
MSDTLRTRLERFLWGSAPRPEPLIHRIARLPTRFAYAVIRDLAEGQLTLRAMSLVYTTLLALVPLLAFSLSVLKGFGVHHQVEPLLYEFLQPLGPRGAELTDQVIAFVDNVKGGVLGGIGLVLLLYTVISMIQKIEDTFNYIWQVQKARSLARRFSDYLSVILVGPVLMVTAMGLLASVSSSALMHSLSGIEPIGSILEVLGRLAPFAVVVLVFTFVYAFVPNMRVRLVPALVGGLLAGAAWTACGSLLASFVVGSTRYAAIYSSFAIAIVALIWLYLSWLILLIGAQIAFYVQNPGRLRSGRTQLKLSIAQVERLALNIMQRVAHGFRSGQQPGFARLASALNQPARALEEITVQLEQAGLLAHTEDGAFVPGRDPETILLVEILLAVRGDDPPVGDPMVATLLEDLRSAAAERLGNRTLADLVAGSDAGPDERAL